MTDSEIQLNIQSDIDFISTEVPCERIVEVSLTAPAAAKASARPNINLALVIDRSGSMGGEKLDFAKLAAVHVLDYLEEKDHVAVVSYDNNVTLVSESVPASAANKARIQSVIRELYTGGSTNLSGGWLQGCQQVAAHAAGGQLNRTLLLTDGLANVGITDPVKLVNHARQLHKRGVSTSTFGIGEDFNEHLLEQMANQGGGNYYFIGHPNEIPSIFQRELSEMVVVTAQGLALSLEFPSGVSATVLGGWKHEAASGQLHIYLGDLASRQSREFYVRFLFPANAPNQPVSIRAMASALSADGQSLKQAQNLTLTAASPDELQSQKARPELMERYSTVLLAETANEVLQLERKGERQQAGKLMDRVIQQAASYASPETMAEYQSISQRVRTGLEEGERKRLHGNAYLNRQRRRPS